MKLKLLRENADIYKSMHSDEVYNKMVVDLINKMMGLTRCHKTGEISTINNTIYYFLPTPLVDTPTLPTLDTLPLLHLINVYLLGPP